jgi:small conductance mechanosensitive channel
VAGVTIAVIALLMILDLFLIDIGPAIAGLGVVGIAVGLGAQTLVRDWLSGIFIVLENQYSQGDVVRIAGVSGVVEDFSLRRTTLRDLDGAVHNVPNGQITVATNLTRVWARVNLDVPVAYGTDIEEATKVINEIGEQLHADNDWSSRTLEAPTVVRVSALGDFGVSLKVLGQVRAAEQWSVAGELRKRIVAGFAERGIKMPNAQRIVVGSSETPPSPEDPTAAAGAP